MGNKSQEIPEQFSNLMGMGTAVEVYRAKTSLVLNIVLAVFFLLGSGAALLYALSIVWERWGRYYPPVILQAVLPWAIGALVAFAVSLLILWRIFSNRKKAAVVYTNGFAYSDRKGLQTWRWDQVQDVTANVVRHYTNGIYTGTTHTYTLQKSSGEKLVLNDSLKEIEAFYNHLENNTLQQRYQRLADAYNNGNPVTFGPVTIGKQSGIQIGKKAFPWEEIEEVAINKGYLTIKKKQGGWFSGATAAAGAIPNLHVLLSIINQIVGLKAGK
jgi:hypothetical protein